ncbi:MAG: glycosyltransferase family 4 protein [Patescibacteria group bacterium]|jgi:phosphatidylinositol alpha-1,6-mannosyltransferase
MNILLTTIEFPPFKGGVANYYGHLASFWPKADNFSVLDNNNGELISGEFFWPWRRAFQAIKDRIKKDKIDYILVGQVLPLGTVIWDMSLFRPCKYAVFFHGMDLSYSLRRFHKRILTGLIIRRADKVICANSYVKSQIDRFYPSGSAKTIIANPGIPKNIPEPRTELMDHLKINYGLSQGSGQINLFTLGRLVKRKGIDKVIAALNGLPEELLDRLRYFVGGVGPEEEYLKAAVPAKLKDKVIFLGSLNEEEKWAWLSLCDVFIMPARDIKGDYEGFGIVYLEANLCGKPVIAGSAGGVNDAVKDGLNGLMVDPEDENSIGDAIIKLAADQDLREKLGRQGRERALNEFAWPALSEKLSRRIKENIL